MHWIALIIGICNIMSGALFIALALPLLHGKIKRNHWYGFRFAAAFRSEQAWLEINRYGAKRLIVWSVVLIAFGVICLFLPLNDVWAIVLAALAPLVAVIAAIESWRFARKRTTRSR